MTMEDTEQALQLRFLYNAAHQYVADNPALSHFYMTRLNNILMTSSLEVPPSIKMRYCGYCFVLFTPGENCDVRVRSAHKFSKRLASAIASEAKQTAPVGGLSKSIDKNKKKKTKPKNILCYHCKVCDKVTPFGGTTPQFVVQKKKAAPITILSVTDNHKKAHPPQQKQKGHKQQQPQPQQPQPIQQPQQQPTETTQATETAQPEKKEEAPLPVITIASIVSDREIAKPPPQKQQQQQQQPNKAKQQQNKGQQQQQNKGQQQKQGQQQNKGQQQKGQQQQQQKKGQQQQQQKGKGKKKAKTKSANDTLRSILQSSSNAGKQGGGGGGLDLYSFLQSMNK